jgi:hypothetical protein
LVLTNLLKMVRVINAVRDEKMQNRVGAAGAPAAAKRHGTSTGAVKVMARKSMIRRCCQMVWVEGKGSGSVKSLKPGNAAFARFTNKSVRRRWGS